MAVVILRKYSATQSPAWWSGSDRAVHKIPSFLRTLEVHKHETFSGHVSVNRLISKLLSPQSAKHFRRNLLHQKVRHCVHRCLPIILILSQTNPVYDLPPRIFLTQFHIILHSMLRPYERRPSFWFPHANTTCTSLLAHTYKFRPCYPPRLVHPTNVMRIVVHAVL